ELEGGALELANGLAELLAGGRPVGREIHRPFRLAAAGGSNEDAPTGQPVIGKIEALAFFAEDLALVEAHIVKEKLVIVIGTVGDAARAAAHLKTGCVAIDQESGDSLSWPALGFVDAGHGKDDGEIGDADPGDEMLATLEDIIIAIGFGAGGDRH